MSRPIVSCVLAFLAATMVAPYPAPAAAKVKKEAKIKLDTLKLGKIVLDTRLGYILVRMGPKEAGKNVPVSVGFSRIDPATGKYFDFPTEKDIPPDFWRTSAVAVNVGRSLGDVDGNGVFLVSAYPGRWMISNVGSTSLAMGSYAFDVKQGEISDIGTLLVAKENGETKAPELAVARLSPDLAEFGVMMNIVMSEAVYLKPSTDIPALPKELSGLPQTKVQMQSDVRFINAAGLLINRALSLQPIGHQPPLTREQAVAQIAKINPPGLVEAVRKRAEKAKANANATR